MSAEARAAAARSWTQLALPAGVLIVLGSILLPVPAVAMDVLLTLNLSAALILVLVVLFSETALGLTVFPTLLLFSTVFRLALNIASTRLILSDGANGTAAAGKVIQALGGIVVRGNIVVGIILFGVIIVIQYVVINHGAVRISEVSARFVLDAMPGKQMSIDADLNAGLIDEVTARERRARISREAEFYGAMDGAVRFTQRDAVAGLIIVAINIVGGLVVGIAQRGMSLGSAFETFTMLTVGDGLANAIPSLLVSVAAALITTRASAESQVGSDVAQQLLRNPAPIYAAGAILGVLALAPGFPTFAFVLLASGLALVARRAAGARKPAALALGAASTQGALPAKEPEAVEKLVAVEKLAIELGYELLPLVGNNEAGLPQRLKALRRELASTLGLVLPTVRITDSAQALPSSYALLLKGNVIARGEILMGHCLVVDSGLGRPLPPGVETRDPAFKLPAVWVRERERAQAEAQGHMVIDPLTVLVTHFSETIKSCGHELLGRQEVKALIDIVAETNPKVIEELTPKLLSLGEIQKVLSALLRERVAIRDLVTILETLADAAAINRSTGYLTEQARYALRRTVVGPYLSEAGELYAVTTSPQIEQALLRTAAATNDAAPTITAGELMTRIKDALGARPSAANPVLLTSPSARALVRAVVEPYLPALPVLSHAELPPGVRIVSLGMVA